jgi:integrase
VRVLEPIWQTKTETASRVRGRIEAVLDWAAARGFRQGENPARWRGHLENLLPKRSKVRRVEHHAALPYAEIDAFMTQLRQQDGVAARALEFAILTAARTEEVLGAQWSEINLSERIWIVPPPRTKTGKTTGKEHRVPLSDAAISIIEAMARIRVDEHVFPGRKGDSWAYGAAARADRSPPGRQSARIPQHLPRLGGGGHRIPAKRREMALAHAIGNQAEAAYRRGDLFEKRRALMRDWALHCADTAGRQLQAR